MLKRWEWHIRGQQLNSGQHEAETFHVYRTVFTMHLIMLILRLQSFGSFANVDQSFELCVLMNI